MKILAFFCILLSAASAAAAEAWTVGPAPSDDPTMRAAMVTNDAGASLYIWSRHDGERFQIFAELHPGPAHKFGRAMPRYRVDAGDEIDTEKIRQDGEALNSLWGYIGPTSAIWLIWTSFQDEILSGDRLHEWFAGREVVISWRTPDGDIDSTRFSLDGAQAAILDASGARVGGTAE